MSTGPDIDPEKLRAALAELDKQRPQAKSTTRVLPVVYNFVIEYDWYRKWTLLERFKILIGYNLNLLIRVKTRHNPGPHQPIIVAEISEFTQASDTIKARIVEDLKDLKVPLP